MTVPALAAALLWRWTEAWAVGVIGAVLIVLAIPFLFGAHAYRVRIELPTTRVIAGDALPVTVAVHNAASRPAMPLVAELPVGEEVFEVAVPFLAPDQSFAQDPEIDAQRRGVLTVGPLTIARRDPVGLFRKEVTWPETHRVYVHPKTVRLPAHTTGLLRDLEGAPLGKLTDSDLAFHAIREYQPGDERRHIHWNSTAKTGAFMVRQFEESQSARVAVLFDPHESAYATAGEFELGVSIAASVGLQAVIDRRERYVYADRELPSRNGEGLLDLSLIHI